MRRAALVNIVVPCISVVFFAFLSAIILLDDWSDPAVRRHETDYHYTGSSLLPLLLSSVPTYFKSSIDE